MKLIDDAAKVIKKAWSIKLAIISAMFGAMEVALPFFTDIIPPNTMAILAVLTAAGSAIARLVRQPSMHDDPDSEA